MNPCRPVPCVAALLVFLLLAGSASHSQAAPMTGELRCQCIQTVSRAIPRKQIASVILLPEGPHCVVPEVIATLNNGRKVCLDPQAPWVKLIVNKIMAMP
ncbi:growth-regulated alpha protein-like [Podarcis muralis]|uniref:C-X-C motif chemokine n=1 Tax=Podarcis muralis TaxID=64176 RepID=A0A670JD79_PODMU|nr:growth-regulated alpha protein-like [Podarcis muralis]